MTAPTFINWDTSNTNIADPGAGQKASGFADNQRVPAKWWNWLFQTIDQCLQYLDQEVGNLGVMTSLSIAFGGFTSGGTITGWWRKRTSTTTGAPAMVELHLPALAATSANNTFTASAVLPSNIRPKDTITSFALVEDNGSFVSGCIQVKNNGDIVVGLFQPTVLDATMAAFFGYFTGSGTKGFQSLVITYPIFP